MSPDQILHLLADGGAVSGFAALCVVCVLWAQRVSDLNCMLDKRLDEMNRRTDQLATAMTELTLTLIAQSSIEQRPALTQALKATLENRSEKK